MDRLDETLRRAAPRLFWGSLAAGLSLPWLLHVGVQVLSRGRRPSDAIDELALNFFAPGYNYFLIGAWNAFAYMVYAVGALFVVGRAHRRSPDVGRRRLWGARLALAAMLIVNAWSHVSILTSRSSTAPIGYLFAPAFMLAAGACGYVVGWFVARRRSSPEAPPTEVRPSRERPAGGLRLAAVLAGWLVAVFAPKLVTLPLTLAGALGRWEPNRATLAFELLCPSLELWGLIAVVAAAAGGYLAARMAPSRRVGHALGVGVLAALTYVAVVVAPLLAFGLARGVAIPPLVGSLLPLAFVLLAAPLGGYMGSTEASRGRDTTA